MSYDIYIGEAVIDLPDLEYPEDGTQLGVHVEQTEHPEAPDLPNDSCTGRGNDRHTGYGAWDDFCRAAGLHELVFGTSGRRDGLFPEHPGCAMLTKAHHAQIAAALDRWRTEHPDAVPGFAVYRRDPATGQLAMADEHYDATLARLIWLEWWVRYALAHCKVPAIYNR